MLEYARYDWKKITEEVFYAEKRLVVVNRQNVEFLKKQALGNQRQRSRLCAHNHTEDITQEMIIILGKGNYVHPHKHLDKSESFHIIEGSADLIFFDEEGQVTDVVELGDYASGNMFYYRIAESLYHSVIVTSDIFVFHETTEGPYIQSHRTDTVFASWAPKESDAQAVKLYMDSLIEWKNKKKEGKDAQFFRA